MSLGIYSVLKTMVAVKHVMAVKMNARIVLVADTTN
jgi:hypothetical protein